VRPSFEFVNGEVTQKPMTKWSHFRIAGELSGLLRDYVRSGAGGVSGEDPTVNMSRGDDRRYRAPDVAFWARGREARRGEILQPPTLAVEIMSQGQTLTSMRAKCREYRSRGVDVAWLINPPRRTVEVFEGERDGQVLTGVGVLESPALPGFRVDLAELFSVLDD
jgi:Uma2 family endonuclease